MYKKAIEKDLQQIFETRRVDFVGVETCIEQDTLCVDISRVRSGAQEGKAWARVYGSVGIRGTMKKNPAGFLTKKISEAEPEVLGRFWFAPVEMPVSTPTEWELKATKLDFVYFYQEEYAPVKGILEYAKMFWDMVVNAIPPNPIDPIPEPEPEPELPTSNGIDEHTVAVWHFDDADGTKERESLDEVSAMAYPYSTQGTFYVRTAAAKFGAAGLFSQYKVSKDFSLASEDEWTIDCWWKPLSAGAEFVAGIGTIITSYGKAQYYNVVFDSAANQNKIYVIPRGTTLYSGNVQEADGNLVANQCYHVAVQKNKKGVLSAYLNGKKVIKYDGVINESTTLGWGSQYGHIDELRISKVARYDEDFTPPEKPYSA